MAKSRRFYLSAKNNVSIEVGLALNYNDEDDEIEGEIGGNFYFYNRSFPLNGQQLDELLGAFAVRNMDNDIFAYTHGFEEVVEKMNKYNDAISTFIRHLCVSINEIVGDVGYLRDKCYNEKLKIHQILNYPGVSTLGFEMATNMVEFFENICKSKSN